MYEEYKIIPKIIINHHELLKVFFECVQYFDKKIQMFEFGKPTIYTGVSKKYGN